MKPQFADLHTHSTASDGSDSPAAIVRAAAARGLRALALTDHDTLDGLDEAAREAEALNLAGGQLEFVRGVEISIATPLDCEVHLLGLWLPPQAPAPLQEALAEVRLYRAERNRLMVERLQALGLPLTLEQVQERAGTGVAGRPHMAQALLELGLVQSRQEAFSRYLGALAPAYVPRRRLPAEKAFTLLKACGAVTCLAHPCLIRCNHQALVGLIAHLAELGLDALEAYHSSHSPADEALLVKLAARQHLALSGGSDYHGAARPEISLGSCFSAALLPGLRGRAERQLP